MRKILIFASAVAILAACSEKKTIMPGNAYPADYVSIKEFPFYDSLRFEDSLPYNFELNKNVETKLTYTFPNTFNLEFEYPAYEATGSFNFAIIDKDKLDDTFNSVTYYMALQGDSIADIEEMEMVDGLRRWIMVHPRGKKQLQWAVMDTIGMYMWGQVEFAAAKDTTIDLSAPIANIRADVEHLLDNLKK